MIGDIIAAGANILGGFLNRESNRQNTAAQERMAAQNIALQKDFAQQGIRWKVEDAREAGIHPLYALGANTTAFSPVSIGTQPDTSLGDSFSRAGQDIGRAVNATRTEEERAAAAAQTALQLEGLKLDNDIKRATIASSVQRMKQAANPPMPGAMVPGAKQFEESPRLRGDLGELNVNPRVVNAEDIEKRYGDIAQELWGAYTMGADWWNHVKKSTKVSRDKFRWFPSISIRPYRGKRSSRPWGE